MVAELLDRAQRRRVGLLEVPELALGERLLAHGAEAELDGLVAVGVGRADREHGAGPASSTVTRSTRPSSRTAGSPSFLARMAVIGSAEGESDLDVHAGGQMVEPLSESTVLGGLVDVDQALVRPDLGAPGSPCP